MLSIFDRERFERDTLTWLLIVTHERTTFTHMHLLARQYHLSSLWKKNSLLADALRSMSASIKCDFKIYA